MPPTSEIAEVPAPAAEHHSVTTTTDLGAVLAGGTPPVAIPVAAQDDLLAAIEARLTNEVLDLANALLKFSAGARSVREELPASAQFGKHITLFFSLCSLHIAQALFQRTDAPLLLDDGAQQLREMGLSLDELVRELDLDGRRFLAVALPNQANGQVFKR